MKVILRVGRGLGGKKVKGEDQKQMKKCWFHIHSAWSHFVDPRLLAMMASRLVLPCILFFIFVFFVSLLHFFFFHSRACACSALCMQKACHCIAQQYCDEMNLSPVSVAYDRTACTHLSLMKNKHGNWRC